MRRDVVHYYEAEIERVFEAYRAAALQKFGKDSQALPYHTVSFGLNYSMKYNMTGGSCNVHLIPYQTGTAVDIRYAIAQIAGARYKKHDADLTEYVSGILRVPAQALELPVETFLDPANQVSAGFAAAQTAAPAPVQPVNDMPSQTQSGNRFCKHCGERLEAGDLFCSNCGQRIG